MSNPPPHKPEQSPPKSDNSHPPLHKTDIEKVKLKAPDLRPDPPAKKEEPKAPPTKKEDPNQGKAQANKSKEVGSSSTTTVDSHLNTITRSQSQGSGEGTVPNTNVTQVQTADGKNIISFEEEPAAPQKGGSAPPPSPGATSESKPTGKGNSGHAEEQRHASAKNEASPGKSPNSAGNQNADSSKAAPKQDGAKEPAKTDKSQEQPKKADNPNPRTAAPDLRKAPEPGQEKGAAGPAPAPRVETQGKGNPGHAEEKRHAPANDESKSGKPANGVGKQDADNSKTAPKQDAAKESNKADKTEGSSKSADGARPRTQAPDLRKAPESGQEKAAPGSSPGFRIEAQGKGNIATERQQALGQLDSVMDPEKTRGRAFVQKLERDLANLDPNALQTSKALAELLYEKRQDGTADTFKYHMNSSKLDDLRIGLQLTKSDADKLTGLVKPPDRPLYMGEGGRLGSAASINEAEATGKIMAVLQAESTLGMGFALETILAGGTADQVRAASDLGSALTGVAGSVAGAAGARDANAGVGRAATEDKAARARQTSETRGRTAEAPKPNSAAGGPDLNFSGTGRGASWNVSLNIDEPLAVGERGISPAESMRRATDLRNRQFLDFMTNQGTKREFPEVPSPAKGTPDLSSTSVRVNPSSLITRPSLGGIKEWDELSAIVMDKAGPSLSGKSPQQAKEVLNRAIREELKDPKTAPGRAISDALVNQLGVPREELFAKRRAGE